MISFTNQPQQIDQADGFAKRSACKHKWQPLTFRFETEALMPDAGGGLRPAIRQPSTVAGRVYCVCMKCASHTYIATQWIGFYLGGDYAEQPDEPDEETLQARPLPPEGRAFGVPESQRFRRCTR